MLRHHFLFAFGYFVAGAFLVNFLYTFFYGEQIGSTPLNVWIQIVAIAYVIVAAIFNVIDRRRNK